jgi:hypothetical protein
VRHIRLATALAGITLALGVAAPPAAAATGDWRTPRCGTVEGDGSVSYTRNDGHTITPTSVPQQPLQYVHGLVPLGANALLAVDSRGALRSSGDAGCTWSALGAVEGLDVPRLTAGGDGSAYVWDQNGLALHRVRGDRVTALPPVATDTGTGVAALAVDRLFPWHLRVVLGDGTVRDSHDAGASFHTVAAPPHADLFVYSAAIDPVNLNHISIGTMGEGVYTTWLGGVRWTQSRLGERVNAFSVAVSPANPLVVWAQGIDLAENDAHVPSEGRHIYRSTDGGHTFSAVVDHVPGQVTLVNGALLAPHPTDAGVLYFVFGTSFANYGTDLFRVDARRGTLTVAHNPHDGIKSISFNPRNPSVMYLGFAAE